MNIDIVTALNSDYIAINPEDKDHCVVRLGNGLPHITQVQNRNETPFSSLRLLANLIKEHPKFMLNGVQINENGNITYLENEALGDLLNPSNILELFKKYQASHEIFEQYQRDETAYRRGERGTHPSQDKPSWVDRRGALLEGTLELDKLCAAVEYQLVRQHSNHSFDYKGDSGLPCKTYLDGKILRIAHEDASENHGHSDFLFDEFEIIGVNPIPPNGKDLIFPVRNVTLRHLATKEGHGEYDFANAFYKQ